MYRTRGDLTRRVFYLLRQTKVGETSGEVVGGEKVEDGRVEVWKCGNLNENQVLVVASSLVAETGTYVLT